MPNQEPVEPIQEVAFGAPKLDLKSMRHPKADIQDKDNKTYSACKISFSIRKSLIKHCELAHGMKFKNKKRTGQSTADNAPTTPPEDATAHKNGETPETLKMRLMLETLQTKEKSLTIKQTTWKRALETAKYGNIITFDQEITIERLINC